MTAAAERDRLWATRASETVQSDYRWNYLLGVGLYMGRDDGQVIQ